MKKYIVISTNDNDNYLFFLPIISWMWKQFGWETIVLHSEIKDNLKKMFVFANSNLFTNVLLVPIENIREETLVQCSRLYAANISYLKEDDYLVTSDIDMLPLSDYWKFDETKITAWGRDLSDRHYPICYVGAQVKQWKEIMNLTNSIERDMEKDFTIYTQSKSSNWEKYWQTDQDILTDKLNSKDVVRIDRGIASNSHYPNGRIDRGCWEKSLQQTERIDSHLLRPGYEENNFNKIIELIKSIFPEQDLSWMKKYREQYIQLI